MTTKPRRIRSALVTGATGFIGTHLVEALAVTGVRVRALVRDPRKAPSIDAYAEPVIGDITHFEDTLSAVAGVDTVFHLAALVGPAAAPLSEYESVNVAGTRNVMKACLHSTEIQRLVHVSTVAVNEAAPPGALVTEDMNAGAKSRYGVTKRASELAARDAMHSGVPVVIARPMWVYGWRSPGTIKLFRLIAQRRMVMIGRAINLIQPIAVEDLIPGLLLSATVTNIEGRIYQFAGPAAMTMKQFCADIAEAIGVPPPKWHLPLSLANVAARIFQLSYPISRRKPPIDANKIAMFTNDHAYSMAEAECDLGWKPSINFREGAEKAVAEMKRHGLLAPIH